MPTKNIILTLRLALKTFLNNTEVYSKIPDILIIISLFINQVV